MKSFSSFLSEMARRNPNVNIKESPVDIVRPYKNSEDVFVHFHDMENVQMNTKRSSGKFLYTPSGAYYCYPVKVLWKLASGDIFTDNNKYNFTSRRYISLYRVDPKAKSLVFSKYSENNLWEDLFKLQTWFMSESKIPNVKFSNDLFLYFLEFAKRFTQNRASRNKNEGSPAGFLWNCLRKIDIFTSDKDTTLKLFCSIWNVNDNIKKVIYEFANENSNFELKKGYAINSYKEIYDSSNKSYFTTSSSIGPPEKGLSYRDEHWGLMSNTFAWHKIIRKHLNYDFVFDDFGHIIHPTHPGLGIFFGQKGMLGIKGKTSLRNKQYGDRRKESSTVSNERRKK
jgi:hypothetical protein